VHFASRRADDSGAAAARPIKTKQRLSEVILFEKHAHGRKAAELLNFPG